MMKTLLLILTCCYLTGSVALAQDAETYYKTGVEKLNAGQYEEAIKLFTSSLELQPKNYMTWYNRGLCKNSLGLYEKSLQDFDQVVKLAPQYKEGYLNRASTKKHLTDYFGAKSDYNQALTLDPNYGAAYYSRATVYQDLNKKDSACLDFNKALSLGVKEAQEQVTLCAVKKDVHSITALTKLATNEKYGFTPENPVKVGKGSKGGPANEKDYLDLLLDGQGNPIVYKRIGSCCPYESKNGSFGLAMTDHYEITYLNEKGKKKTGSLYLSFYDFDEPQVPFGLKTK